MYILSVFHIKYFEISLTLYLQGHDCYDYADKVCDDLQMYTEAAVYSVYVYYHFSINLYT